MTEWEPEGGRAQSGFGYGEAIERILALESEVVDLRDRLEGLSARFLSLPNLSSRAISAPSPAVEVSGPLRPPESPLLAVSAAVHGSTESPGWSPRRKKGCPECGRAVSADSLSRHRRRAHMVRRPAGVDGP